MFDSLKWSVNDCTAVQWGRTSLSLTSALVPSSFHLVILLLALLKPQRRLPPKILCHVQDVCTGVCKHVLTGILCTLRWRTVCFNHSALCEPLVRSSPSNPLPDMTLNDLLLSLLPLFLRALAFFPRVHKITLETANLYCSQCPQGVWRRQGRQLT